jgi:choline transport protein
LVHLDSGVDTELQLSGGIKLDTNHHVQPTKKQFRLWTIIAFSFLICNSWSGVSASIQVALQQGGPVTLVYSIIICTVIYGSLALSMAELASVYPTAGGQYHFTSILAPESIKRQLSYLCGLLAMLAWVAIGASVTLITAEQIFTLAQMKNEHLLVKNWQIFLLYQGIALWVLMVNCFFLKGNPWIHNIGCKFTLPYSANGGGLSTNVQI